MASARLAAAALHTGKLAIEAMPQVSEDKALRNVRPQHTLDQLPS